MTTECYEKIRKLKKYRATNGAWNHSKINHPSNIGYLMDGIKKCAPSRYEDWERYFYENFASKEQMKTYAQKFRSYVLKDKELTAGFDYEGESPEFFLQAVECRLIYETWLGYRAEKFVLALLHKKIKSVYSDAQLEDPSAIDDNKYAVDSIVRINGRRICGIQVKSMNYLLGNFDMLTQTKIENNQKNKSFTLRYNIPVIYAYYHRDKNKLRFVNCNEVIQSIGELL